MKQRTENINKTSQPLATLTKEIEDKNKENCKQKRRHHNKYHRNTKAIRKYYRQLYANKLDNLGQMEKFLEHTLTKPKSGRNRKFEQNYQLEISSVIKNLPAKKTPEPDGQIHWSI